MICTGKCRIPSTREAASRQVAKASGRMSSKVSPLASRSLKAGVLARSSLSDRALYSSSKARTCFKMGSIRLTSFSE